MLSLTRGTVAELAIQGYLPTQLILHSTTMALGVIASLEMLIGLVDAIWWTLLPLSFISVLLLLALVLCHCPVDSNSSRTRCESAVVTSDGCRETW